LQTALTGADTFYTNSNQTYSGIYMSGQPGVSTISQIDTGLTYISGTTATSKSNTISIKASGALGYLILAAFAPGTKDCWIVVDQKAAQSTSIAHNANLATGTYYGVIKNGAAACTAASGLAGTNFQTTGFPTG